MANTISSGANAILEAIRDFISSFFERGNSAIGVDLGSSAIKVVQLKKKKGKAVLETYGELALGSYAGVSTGQATNLPEKKLSEALLDIIREANVSTTDAGISVSLASSLLLVIEMPVVKGASLKEMVPIEARKYIPVPIGEVTLDWRLIPSAEESEDARESGGEERKTTKVLLAAIHNETINKYQHIAIQSGLAINFLEIEVFSSVRALLDRERVSVLILDIGAGTTKLAIIENGIPLSSHIINRGSQDITVALSASLGVSTLKAEEMKRERGFSNDPIHKETNEVIDLIIGGIFSEASRVLLDYEKKYNKIVGKVILSGGGSLLKGILEVAQKSFDTDVVFARPFSKVETPAFLDPALKQAGPNFAVALGVALRRLQELE